MYVGVLENSLNLSFFFFFGELPLRIYLGITTGIRGGIPFGNHTEIPSGISAETPQTVPAWVPPGLLPKFIYPGFSPEIL